MMLNTKLVAISTLLVVMAISVCVGCGNAKMKITTFDTSGRIKAVNEVSYTVFGSRKLEGVDVNIKSGKAKIGSSEGSAGDLAEALLNLSRKIP